MSLADVFNRLCVCVLCFPKLIQLHLSIYLTISAGYRTATEHVRERIAGTPDSACIHEG